MSQLKDVVFDCVEAWPLAQWWAETLGYRVRDDGEGDPDIALDPVDAPGPSFWFCAVPEAKVTKNRVHIDVYGDVDTLSARGASVVDVHEHWTVMADPEGNEFCVFPESSRGTNQE